MFINLILSSEFESKSVDTVSQASKTSDVTTNQNLMHKSSLIYVSARHFSSQAIMTSVKVRSSMF